ncbi:hypothetical protein KSC_090020 [Ktedonobacter sp. SOSP1-52]|nr:hypothetical protein KSC_090020 [Ktedonobacter sp. SOSP1-52]
MRGTRLLGLLIGLGGVATLLGLDAGGDTQRLLEATLVLLAATGYAVGALLIKRPTIATLPSLGVMTVECLTATAVLAPLAMTRLPGRIPDLEVIVSLLVLGLICSALAYLLFFALVAEVGASQGSVITYVVIGASVRHFLGVLVTFGGKSHQ